MSVDVLVLYFSGCPNRQAAIERVYAASVRAGLPTQVSTWLRDQLGAAGVGAVIEAEHLCMTLRGVQAPGTTTVTSSLLGLLREDARTRSKFLALTRSSH